MGATRGSIPSTRYREEQTIPQIHLLQLLLIEQGTVIIKLLPLQCDLGN